MNCAVLCIFPPCSYGQVAEIVHASTDWETSTWELLKVGERALNLARSFNVRGGFMAKDDDIPKKFFNAFTEGPLSGVEYSHEDFKEAKKLYYQMMNWDLETGAPQPRSYMNWTSVGW